MAGRRCPALYAGAVAFSELYDGLLADHLTAALPVGFSWRERGPRRAPAFEARHGRPPTRVETIRLRQQATLATRPATTVHPLTQLRAEWTQRVAASGRTPTGVSDEALANSPAASTTR